VSALETDGDVESTLYKAYDGDGMFEFAKETDDGDAKFLLETS
jgi:hypothetical protein